jgi:flagellum-specific ATP synthase
MSSSTPNDPNQLNTRAYLEDLYQAPIYREGGKVSKSFGLLYEAYLPGAAVGSICRILNSNDPLDPGGTEAEVVGFRDRKIMLMTYEDPIGINNGSLVVVKRRLPTIPVGRCLLGRVIDGRGNPIDGKGPLQFTPGNFESRSIYNRPSHPLEREVISQPLDLGVRAINGLITAGRGQRVGIMAGSGVGKSVLLGMMARNTDADINVIALIGERGREVREFIERDLGEEGLARSVVVVVTSDKSPLLRMRGAFVAMTIAEFFRDQGSNVLLLMDSITRFCMAQREIGLALGEPPASKGYTPSVFSTIPKLLERAGMAPTAGSITGLFSVLVEGDDMDDPIADSVRGIVDGHIVLSRRIAQRNHFPAIDILQSTSRVMRSVTDETQLQVAGQLRDWMAAYSQAEDLVNLGAYVKGSNPRIDQAILAHDRIERFLKQRIDEKSNLSTTQGEMIAIVRSVDAQVAAATQASVSQGRNR